MSEANQSKLARESGVAVLLACLLAGWAAFVGFDGVWPANALERLPTLLAVLGVVHLVAGRAGPRGVREVVWLLGVATVFCVAVVPYTQRFSPGAAVLALPCGLLLWLLRDVGEAERHLSPSLVLAGLFVAGGLVNVLGNDSEQAMRAALVGVAPLALLGVGGAWDATLRSMRCGAVGFGVAALWLILLAGHASASSPLEAWKYGVLFLCGLTPLLGRAWGDKRPALREATVVLLAAVPAAGIVWATYRAWVAADAANPYSGY